MSVEVKSRWQRRGVLAGLAGSAVAGPVLGQAASSPRPIPRGAAPVPAKPEDIGSATQARIAAAGLSGDVSFSLIDARSGAVVLSREAAAPLPPASVTKAITAAYAYDSLGPGHRFQTRVLATGPVRDGRLDGDLVLVGGGTPGLASTDLVELVSQLTSMGLREVSGRFLVWAGALPQIPAIDPGQPAHLGYNPSVGGLNLNFNRVHFDWKRNGNGYQLLMDARAGKVVPPVSHSVVRLSDRSGPVWSYDAPEGDREVWSVARSALGSGGARWLPVRRGDLYTADVFQTLARNAGIDLSNGEIIETLPEGRVLANVQSAPMGQIARGMLRFSTNLTAEVLGMASSVRRGGALPVDLAASAAQMTDWTRADLGMMGSRFVDHSGLGGDSRVTAKDMVGALRRLGPDGALARSLREISVQTEQGRPAPLRLAAKTGTLNFVSALAGHVTPTGGRDLIFAIFTADLAKRAAVAPEDREKPAGNLTWTRASRRMQYDLVRLWARLA